MNDPTFRNRQVAHGVVLLVGFLFPLLVPALRHWPWYLLAPLAVYAVVVLAVPGLRRSICWLRVGSAGPRVMAATLVLILVSSATLILYRVLVRPDLHELVEQLPNEPASWLLVGVVFATVNALLEEAIFRGILLDAFAAQAGVRMALFVQAVLFGIGHAHGYPPGVIGAVLAGVYGLLLGLLRLYARGMVAVAAAHICADATIFWIVTQ